MPTAFFARYKGLPGHLLIPAPSSPPGRLRFRAGIQVGLTKAAREDRFDIPIADLVGLRKVGGFNVAGIGTSSLGLGLDDLGTGLEILDTQGKVRLFLPFVALGVQV